MLRGVNKQIIEINSTDNRYFEKAILFVRPEFSETSEGKLRDNASEFLKYIETEKQLIKKANPKTKKQKMKLNKKIVMSLLLTVGIIAASIVIILKMV